MISDFTKQKDYYFLSLVILGAISSFFISIFIHSNFSVYESKIFNSPDETANYFFTKQLHDEKLLYSFEPLGSLYGEIIHPRSSVLTDGRLVPVSFPGIILYYGFISFLTGIDFVPYITVIFSFFAVLSFYGIVKEIFNKKIAFFSGVLMLLFPGWQYYTARSMYHNVLFVSCCIIGIYFLTAYYKKKKTVLLVASSFFLSASLVVRLSEAVWVGVIFLTAVLLKRKKISFRDIVIFISTFILFLLPLVVFNTVTYGSALKFGYSPPNPSGNEIHKTFVSGVVKNIVIPFGLKPKSIAYNFIRYYVIIFWWYCSLLVAGIYVFLKAWKKRTAEQKAFFLLFVFISFYLTVFYGSWRIVDNLDPDKITIGTSYVRYWLPMFIFSLPFIGFFINSVVVKIKDRKIHSVFLLFLFIIISYFSISITWMKGEESLFSVRENIIRSHKKKESVAALIPDKSVIIAERNDKIFFPEYKVISTLDDQYIQTQVSVLVRDYDVYYYSFFSPEDIQRIRDEILEKNIDIELIKNIYNNENLYKIIRIE